MKTSSKLLAAAILIIILSIVWFDAKILSVYNSGAYKLSYYKYKTLDFKNFDVLDIEASSQANIRITQGPFKVSISKGGADKYTTVTQEGNHLKIKVSMASHQEDHNDYTIMITCPRLKVINADSRYRLKNETVVDTIASDDRWYRKTTLAGFTLDSLTINQNNGSFIILAGDQIKVLNAIVGSGINSGAFLDVSKNNKINQASIDVRNKSTLIINDELLKNVKHTLADSASMRVIGGTRK